MRKQSVKTFFFPFNFLSNQTETYERKKNKEKQRDSRNFPTQRSSSKGQTKIAAVQKHSWNSKHAKNICVTSKTSEKRNDIFDNCHLITYHWKRDTVFPQESSKFEKEKTPN